MDLRSEVSGVGDGFAMVMKRMRKGMNSAMREVAKGRGLSQNEIEVLLFLSHGRHDTARELSRSQGISRSLVSRSVDLLVKKEYIKAEQDETDRRLIHLRLLPAADQVVEALNQVREAYIRNLWAGITQEEVAAFHAILRKVMTNIENTLPDESHNQGRNPDNRWERMDRPR